MLELCIEKQRMLFGEVGRWKFKIFILNQCFINHLFLISDLNEHFFHDIPFSPIVL